MTASGEGGRYSGEALLGIAVVLWSINFTATKVVIAGGLAPLSYASLRWSVAGIVLAGLTMQRERSLRIQRRDIPVVLGMGVVGIWLNQLLFVHSIQHAQAATVALAFGTLPLAVGAIAHALRVERVSRRHALATCVSLSGVGLVAFGGSRGGLEGGAYGIGLALGAVVTFALYSVIVIPLFARYSPLRLTTWIALTGGALLGLSGFDDLAGQTWSVSVEVWVYFGFASLGAVVFGNIMWLMGVDAVGPGRAAVVGSVQPFLGAVFAVVLLSENLVPVQIVGGSVIAVAIAIALSRQGARPPSAPGV